MRRLHRVPAAKAGLLALAVSIGATASAQITFASSNNPAATIRLERTSAGESTVLHIRQSRQSVSYVALSQNTVLRDPATGISYPLRGLDVEVDRATLTEHYTLRFDPFDAATTQVELLDPTNVNGALYFKGVQLANPLAAARPR